MTKTYFACVEQFEPVEEEYIEHEFFLEASTMAEAIEMAEREGQLLFIGNVDPNDDDPYVYED